MSTGRVRALRVVVALAVLVSAGVHLYVYLQGFAAIPVIGPLFLATVIGGVVIAAAVAFWRHWIPALLAAGFALTTVAAYWVSVVHGLFGVREVTGGWPEIVAEAAEYAAIVLGAVAATALWRQQKSLPSPRSRRSETTAPRHRGPGAATPANRTTSSPDRAARATPPTQPTWRIRR